MSTNPPTKLYVVVGTTEEIGQDVIGGPFEPHYSKELVIAFRDRQNAEEYIKNNKLVKPRRESTFSGMAYYKKGYYDLEVEEVELAN